MHLLKRALAAVAILAMAPMHQPWAQTGPDRGRASGAPAGVSAASRKAIPPGVYSPQRAKLFREANENTVTVISGTPAGTYLSIAYDMAAVLDEDDKLRVLPVAGRGSVQNVKDILHLRGVDMGIVQSDVMTYFKMKGEAGDPIDQRLVYITPLYIEELHVVANESIPNLQALAGKKVSFGEVGSGTQYSCRLIFDTLGIKVEEVNMGKADGLLKTRNGEIAATLFIGGHPAPDLIKPPKNHGYRILPVPYTRELEEMGYLPSKLSHSDYPDIVPDETPIETIAVSAVLAVYNWPPGHDRHRKVTQFVDALFSKIAKFREAPRHPKWREVNIGATLPGWRRFPAAQEWLDRHGRGAAPATTATK
jgi:TRAP transporter TAXI family solute receptor